MPSDWNDCATPGCWHLGVLHEADGPCTVTGCQCGLYREQASA